LTPEINDPVQEFLVGRYRQGQVAQARDREAVEEPLEIRPGGEPFQVLMRLPGWEKVLPVRPAFSEKISKTGLPEWCPGASSGIVSYCYA
jgi:formate dehydrogenase assembly factor FdhD